MNDITIGFIVVGLMFVAIGLYEIFSNRYRHEINPDDPIAYGRFGQGVSLITTGFVLCVIPLSIYFQSSTAFPIITLVFSIVLIVLSALVHFSDAINDRFWNLTWHSHSPTNDRKALSLNLLLAGTGFGAAALVSLGYF